MQHVGELAEPEHFPQHPVVHQIRIHHVNPRLLESGLSVALQ